MINVEHRIAIACSCTPWTTLTRSWSAFWTCWTGAKALMSRLSVSVMWQPFCRSSRRSACRWTIHSCLTSTTCRRKKPSSSTLRESLACFKWFDIFIKLISSLLNSVPDGIYLKQLVPEQGEKINDLWPHKHNGSLYFIQRLIEMNMNIGAFTKEDDELIAWCLRWEIERLKLWERN